MFQVLKTGDSAVSYSTNAPKVRKVTITLESVDFSESGYSVDLAAHFHVRGELVSSVSSVAAAIFRVDV